MNFNYSNTNEPIKAGDKVVLEFEFPKDLNYIGRADKVISKILKENNGILKKKDY